MVYTFDRLGRQQTVVRNGMTTTFTNNLANEVMGESYSGGTLSGLSVSNRYDQWLRRTNLTLLNSTTPLVKHSFAYDNASRLSMVTDNTGATPYSAAYTYLANSPLVSQIQYKQSSTARMTTSKSYDFLNRLTQISNAPTASASVAFGYGYNSANQRTAVTNADGSYWVYTYDSLGQVTGGVKHWSDGTPVAGQQFGYNFDDIGNRLSTTSGGDQFGANLRSATYTPNTLNQYTSRTVPGAVEVIGTLTNSANIIVNNNPAYRKGTYFRVALSVANGSGPVYQSITNLAALPGNPDVYTNVTGSFFVPQTPEGFTNDVDGNLTRDGRWAYTWDAENRLVQMVASTAVAPQQLIKFEYDSRGRRIRKQVWPNTSGSGNPSTDIKFVYDGWNLVGQLSTNNAALCAWMWGSDLSESPQGAGGVGGLLEMVYYGSSTTNAFAAFDGNGNLAALVNGADGSTVAQYEYGPFGEVIRATGPMAKANPFRFSTKYQDDESDLIYFGRRYYRARFGRWLARDPMSEKGAGADYIFTRNNPLTYLDLNGLLSINIKEIDNIKCERTAARYLFQLAIAAPRKGYMVLKNTLRVKLNKGCDGNDCPFGPSDDHTPRPSKVFWEAFPVSAGHAVNALEESILGFSDQAGFSLPHSLRPSCGYSEVVGELKFFLEDKTGYLGSYPDGENGPLPPGWIDPTKDRGHAHPTIMPYTYTKPAWWDDIPVEGPAPRSALTIWACGCYCDYCDFIHIP